MQSASPAAAVDEIAIDAHVHLHRPADDTDALHSAVRNFAGRSAVRSTTGVLMLAELEGQDGFGRLKGIAARLGEAPCDEPSAQWIPVDGWRIVAVAGRQIVTAEGIEVLALGTRTSLDNARPLEDTLASAIDDDAMVVLPWGFGKWWGRRGRLVRRALERMSVGQCWLGDNGGRPVFWNDALLALGTRRGVRILPGSDPLPLSGEYRRIGSFGFALTVTLSRQTPVADLKRALRDPARAIRPFGTPEAPARFLHNQWRLRRTGRPTHASGTERQSSA